MKANISFGSCDVSEVTRVHAAMKRNLERAAIVNNAPRIRHYEEICRKLECHPLINHGTGQIEGPHHGHRAPTPGPLRYPLSALFTA
jgi:hypothetical protein